GLSAQLAYFFLLSLFPFLLFIVTLMGFLPVNGESIMQFLSSFLPEDVVSMIESNLSDIVGSRSGGLLSVGILGTLWSASNADYCWRYSICVSYLRVWQSDWGVRV